MMRGWMDRSNRREENLIRGQAENADQQMRTSRADTHQGQGKSPSKGRIEACNRSHPTTTQHLAKPEETIEKPEETIEDHRCCTSFLGAPISQPSYD